MYDKFRYVGRLDLAPRFGLKEGHHALHDFGSSLTADLVWQIADNIKWKSRLYGFTSYKVDLDRQPFPDPVWQWDTSYGVKDESCSQHWAELLFGIDAKVAGPLHMGWSVRYRRRLVHDEGILDKTWYVPGYGIQESTRLGYTFNVMIDI